jgi:hypothetical protein
VGVSIPQPFVSTIIGPVGPVTVAGIPNHFTIDTNLAGAISSSITSLPVIELAVHEIPKIQLAVDPVEIRLTEFPSIRGHLPADFNIGLSVFGIELLNVRLCGEAQIITEPYRPNPCERCGPMMIDAGVEEPMTVGTARRYDEDSQE